MTSTESKPYNPAQFHERLSVWFRNLWHWKTRFAVNHLSKQFRNDPEFREAWKANIAMTIYDATRPQCRCVEIYNYKSEFHGLNCPLNLKAELKNFHQMPEELSNAIADRILRHIFDA